MKEKREFLDYLEDFVDAVTLIEEYTQNMDHEDFMGNHLVQDGAIRQIMLTKNAYCPQSHLVQDGAIRQIMGEAAKRIPSSVKATEL